MTKKKILRKGSQLITGYPESGKTLLMNKIEKKNKTRRIREKVRKGQNK